MPVATGADPLVDTPDAVAARTAAAWGHREPDLLLKGAHVLLPTGELLRRDVAVVGSRIAAVAEDLSGGERVVRLDGKTIVPAYFEPHTHALGPLSLGSYCGQALVHGVATVISDDSFVYGFLGPEQYPPMLDAAARLPLLLRWSLRLEGPRTVPLSTVRELLRREDVVQVGELMARPVLEQVPEEVAATLAAARSRGLRVEGHAPGASPRTLAAAAAAGVGAEHESRRAEEVRERLRLGLWTPIRHTGMLPDAPEIVTAALADGISLERASFATDWTLPPWIAKEGLIDAAVAAVIDAGLPAAEAHACASRRPAAYYGLDAHVGVVAPGRLAALNVLDDIEAPSPRRVFSQGREVARDGELLVRVPEVPWEEIGAPRWSERRRGPHLDSYRLLDDDPSIVLEAPSVVRMPTARPESPGIVCVAIDPDLERISRARLHGPTASIAGVASTLTPRRLLIAFGSDPQRIKDCVDVVFAMGGGIAYAQGNELRRLSLPVGGVLTTASFDEIEAYWRDIGSHFATQEEILSDPISTMLYLGSDSIPGARFNADGLIDTRTGRVLSAPQPIRWG